MSVLPAVYRKTLPVFFMQGYIGGLWHAFGSGELVAAYQLAAQELVPDKYSRDLWLEPLEAYFGHTTQNPQPLDYSFVALFQSGFYLNGSDYFKLARTLTRAAGNEWWFGETPLSTYQDETGLQKHFAPHLWRTVNPLKYGAPEVTIDTVKNYRELGISAITAFIDSFQQESGIAIQLKVFTNSIEIDVGEYPFCLHKHDLCYIFPGLISGLLDWLHGHKGYKSTDYQYFKLNERASRNHHVVIHIRW